MSESVHHATLKRKGSTSASKQTGREKTSERKEREGEERDKREGKK